MRVEVDRELCESNAGYLGLVPDVALILRDG